MAKYHINSKLRSRKSILDGQKVYFNKISHAPYRYTLAASHSGQRGLRSTKKNKKSLMDLNDLLEKVDSRQSFLDFVAALRDDKIDEEQKEKIEKSSPYGPGANGWENGTIETFLDAVHSFGQDSSHVTEHPDWKTFALLLYAGKFYE